MKKGLIILQLLLSLLAMIAMSWMLWTTPIKNHTIQERIGQMINTPPVMTVAVALAEK